MKNKTHRKGKEWRLQVNTDDNNNTYNDERGKNKRRNDTHTTA
jgi:hypothetical protein